jgi:hypothetical protein
MNGFRLPAQPTHRERQDAINEQMVATVGKLTRVLKGHEAKILELEQRLAALEGHGTKPDEQPGNDLSLVTS